MIRRVAQLADAIAIVKIGSTDLEPPQYENWPLRLTDAQMVRLVNGPKFLRRGLRSAIEIDSPKMMVTADRGTSVQTAEQYILLLQHHTYGRSDTLALYPCGILTLTDSNLAMVQQDPASFF